MDCWARWITCGRQGGSTIPQDVLDRLHEVRDRLLGESGIRPGDVVLDVGSGDGLIGFGALDRVGRQGRVIFSDISAELVDRCRRTADEMGVLDRCQFVVSSATDLRRLEAASVDVVTIRSVLIYVADKLSAFREFFRVLRPGGRLSVGEPINRFTYPEPRGVFLGYDVSAVQDAVDKLEAFFDREERPKISAMMDFDELDLLALIEQVGFIDIRMDLRAEIKPMPPEDWARFLKTAGNPLSPTLEEAMAAALTADEQERFVTHLRPLVESGNGTERRAFAFIRALKPIA